MNIKYIKNSHEEFPELLREIPHIPKGIHIKGAPIGEEPKIGIVGTRRASVQGIRIAQECAAELARSGVTVVSGLAMGIDTAAHTGVIQEKGKTIAVLANGLDRVYPRQNEKLAKDILDLGGTIVSEYPEGAEMYPSNFLARNRIISGLCTGVIIIEAPERSGALATARYAVEQNRDVYAVPGPVHSVNYAGSNNLLKEGAKVITSAKDVLLELGIEQEKDIATLPLLDETQKAIMSAFKTAEGLLSIDKIKEMTKIGISEINSALTRLVIQGVVKEERGKYYL